MLGTRRSGLSRLLLPRNYVTFKQHLNKCVGNDDTRRVQTDVSRSGIRTCNLSSGFDVICTTIRSMFELAKSRNKFLHTALEVQREKLYYWKNGLLRTKLDHRPVVIIVAFITLFDFRTQPQLMCTKLQKLIKKRYFLLFCFSLYPKPVTYIFSIFIPKL